MALVETYVDPDNSAGTDYTSLNAWEAGEQTDLVTAGDSHKVWCKSSSGTADTTTVEISGWSTGSSNTLTIQAAEGHEASTSWSSTKYRLDFNASGTSHGLWMRSVSNITVDGLQIKGTTGQTLCTFQDTSGSTVKNCYFKDHVNTTLRAVIRAATTSNRDILIYNNVINGSTSNHGISIETGRGSACNNTVVNQGNTGIYCSNARDDSVFKNNIIFDNATDINTKAVNTVDYNYSSDATATGTNSLTNQSDPFTDSANGDFSLASGSNAIDAGIGPSSDANVPTTDINGETRSGTTCDIGAAEYVAAVTNILTNYYYTHLMQGGL